MAGGDFPALALDGNDELVEVVASNAGHLLYSGMLSAAEAARVTTRLLDVDMFTGWGIRTLSSNESRFNPLAYHNGSVWPHDTMLAAVGMASYGMRNEAKILASAMVDAAAHFDNRPPELFGGFDRGEYAIPVRFADAAVPQAWASAAMLAAVRILRDKVPPHRESR
jgi:glycogen debranching enzyme